jgi:hypothetical protein
LRTQGAAPITRPLQELGGGVAADFKATHEQLLRQLQGLEIGPAHGLIGGAAGAMGLQNLVHRLLQPRLACAGLGAAAPAAADALGAATGTVRVVGVVVAHRRQLADAGVDGTAAHPQDAPHVGDAAKANLQRLQRRVAPPVVSGSERA